MKRIVFLLLAIACFSLARSQTVGVTRYDSTFFAPPAGKPGNEIIIQNATKARTGAFLQNYNQGRTRFAYAVDSIWIASGSLYARRGDTTLVYGLPSGSGTALTPEDVEDIIGGILGPEFSYNDAANLITVNAIDWSKISGKPPIVSFETDPTVPAWVKSITTANIAYWNGKQDALGFTPENVANKSPFSSLGLSNTLYPTQRAVKVYVDSLFSTVAATGSDSVFNYVFPLYDSSGFIKISGYNPAQWNEVYNWYQSNPLSSYATILQLNTKQDKLGFTPVPDAFSLTINGITKQLTGSGQTFTIPVGYNVKDSIYFMPRWFYVMSGENGAMDSVFMDETVDSLIFGSISKDEAYNTFLKISDYNPQNIFNADLQQGASHTHDANGHSLIFQNGDSLQLAYDHIFLQAPSTDLPTDSAYYRDENGALQYGPINAPPQVNADWLADEGSAAILNKPSKLSDFENDLPPGVTGISLSTPNLIFQNPVTFTQSGTTWAGLLALNTQAPHTFLGGPLTGSAAPPTFRQPNVSDIATNSARGIAYSQNGVLVTNDSLSYNPVTKNLSSVSSITAGAGLSLGNTNPAGISQLVLTNDVPTSQFLVSMYGSAQSDARFANRAVLASSTGFDFFSYGLLGTNMPKYANYKFFAGVQTGNQGNPGAAMLTLQNNGHLLLGTDTNDVANPNIRFYTANSTKADTVFANVVVAGSSVLGGPAPASSISGLISQGANVTITGSGTAASPYVINSGGGSSLVDFSEEWASTATTKTLAHAPAFPSAVQLFYDDGTGFTIQTAAWFTISGTTLTLNFTPTPSGRFKLFYRY